LNTKKGMWSQKCCHCTTWSGNRRGRKFMSYSTRKGGSLSDGEMGRPTSNVYVCLQFYIL